MATEPEPSEKLRKLPSRYSYMFPLQGQERARAYAWFRGWLPEVAVMCDRIDLLLGDNKRDFHWIRVREKFGAPSFHYQMEGKARFAVNLHRPQDVRRVDCAPRETFDPVAVAVQEVILETEVELRSHCIICGAPATITNAQGPWASLCAFHSAADLPTDPADTMGPVWKAARLAEEDVFEP